MNDYVGALAEAYYDCLRGNIIYDTDIVPVYKSYVPSSEKGHHIIVRPESESDESNKQYFVTRPVIVVEVLTVHDGGIDASVVHEIGNQVGQMIQPSRRIVGPHMPGEVQLLNIKADNSTYLEGYNGSKHEHRKITRYSNTLNQKI